MKKRLVMTLIPVVGAMAAPAAMAASLNIYGVAHGSLDASDDGVNSDTYIASNSSRLGFSGDHDMGNGLTAIYQFETGVDLTGAGTNDGNGGSVHSTGQVLTGARDAFVGASGGFGTVKLGRVGGLNQWLYDINYFADQVGDLGNIWGASGVPGRVSSSISYSSPDISGFNGTLIYAPEEGVTNMDNTILKINYAMDALKVGLGHATVGTGTSNDQSALALTGSYDFGSFDVILGFQSDGDMGGVVGADADSITFGARADVGAGAVKLQVTTIDPEGNNNDATQFAIGYDHPVSDAATLNVAYASTDNDSGAMYGANNYGHGDSIGAAAAGQDPSSFSIGFVYAFNASVK